MTDETMQKIDAETVAEIFPLEFDFIQRWVKEGRKLSSIDKEISNWFPGWHFREHYQGVCRNTARSLQRELAREALKGAGDTDE